MTKWPAYFCLLLGLFFCSTAFAQQHGQGGGHTRHMMVDAMLTGMETLMGEIQATDDPATRVEMLGRHMAMMKTLLASTGQRGSTGCGGGKSEKGQSGGAGEHGRGAGGGHCSGGSDQSSDSAAGAEHGRQGHGAGGSQGEHGGKRHGQGGKGDGGERSHGQHGGKDSGEGNSQGGHGQQGGGRMKVMSRLMPQMLLHIEQQNRLIADTMAAR